MNKNLNVMFYLLSEIFDACGHKYKYVCLTFVMTSAFFLISKKHFAINFYLKFGKPNSNNILYYISLRIKNNNEYIFHFTVSGSNISPDPSNSS